MSINPKWLHVFPKYRNKEMKGQTINGKNHEIDKNSSHQKGAEKSKPSRHRLNSAAQWLKSEAYIEKADIDTLKERNKTVESPIY